MCGNYGPMAVDPTDPGEAVLRFLAGRRYTQRYQAPRERDDRVTIEIRVDHILGQG